MSPRKLTPLALAALVLLSGSAFAVPAIDHGPPTDTDEERESFAPVPVYGPVLDEPVFTLLTHEPRADMVYGPGLNGDLYDLRVLPENWRQLVEDSSDIDADDDGADIRNPWADRDSAPLQDAPSDDGSMVPCGCHSTNPDDPSNTAPTDPSGGDDAPNHGHDGDDVDNDDGMDGDDSDSDDTDADDSDDGTDVDSDDGTDADNDDSDRDSDDTDGDDSDSDDSDDDDGDADDSDGDDDSVDDGDDSDI